MPYVKPETRAYQVPNAFLWETAGESASGELNYRITNLINGYLKIYGFDYQRINDVIGALEGAKLEFYRRLVAPYETGKMHKNGDVYAPCLLQASYKDIDEQYMAGER